MNKSLKSYITELSQWLLATNLDEMVKNVECFFNKTKHKRDYTAKDVALLRGAFCSNACWAAMTASYTMRKKIEAMGLHSDTHFRALGALNPTQARAMIEATTHSDAPFLDGLYLSGWQEASSGENEYGDMFPDQSLYPSNSVPQKILKINNVLEAADRIKWQQLNDQNSSEELKNTLHSIDYQSPIIADIEAGFGQEIHAFQLALTCIKAGVACLHLEDQDGSLKKCGHMGGKVKVPIPNYITKLKAIRLAADVLGTDIVIIGRTDARGTKLINNVSDTRDDKFCMKTLEKAQLFDCASAIDENLNNSAVWETLLASSFIDTYTLNGQDSCILSAELSMHLNKIDTDKTAFHELLKHVQSEINITQSQAKELCHIFKQCKYLRTKDGYYRYKAGLDAAIEVGLACADYVDLIWFETSEPDLEEAKRFAEEIHKQYPGKKFHYNCSPSFNWSKHFKNKHGKQWKEELITFNHKLAALGYKSQKITLFGMHVVNQAIKTRVIEFQKRNMGGYSELQDEEKETGNRSYEHQSFVGVDVWGSITSICAGEDSELLASSGESATMNQFH